MDTTNRTDAQPLPKLLDLPSELLGYVAEALDGFASLVSFANTCSRFHPVASARLYHSLGWDGNMGTFSSSVSWDIALVGEILDVPSMDSKK